MRRLVIDASVVVKWFKVEQEAGVEEALALLADFEAGRVLLAAPALLPLELLNVLGRRARWPEPELRAAAARLDRLALQIVDPDLVTVARWVGRGLSAYDAAYVAVADGMGAPLVTADARILAVAAPLAVALVDAADERRPGKTERP